jgi:hypothetical protein
MLATICPETGKIFSTGVHTDALTLAKVWFAVIDVRCPHCGKHHAVNVREVYIDAVMSADSLHVRPNYSARTERTQVR